MLHAYDLIVFVHMHSVPYSTDTPTTSRPTQDIHGKGEI